MINFKTIDAKFFGIEIDGLPLRTYPKIYQAKITSADRVIVYNTQTEKELYNSLRFNEFFVNGVVSANANAAQVLLNDLVFNDGNNSVDFQPIIDNIISDLNLKENSENKSNSILDFESTLKFPVWKAIISYFDVNKIKSILGITSISGSNTGDETISTIQTKRPLKTIEGQSLEGNGNIDLQKSDVGLSNVDNTSDINKPISILVQTQLTNLNNADILQGNVVGNNLVITLKNGTSITIDATAFTADVRVTSGLYNATTKAIDFNLSNSTIISVPVSQLLPVIHDNTISGDGANTPLKVELSSDATNILIYGTDGKLLVKSENNENNQTYFTDFVGNEGTVFSNSAGIGGGQANFFATEINHNGILRFIQNNANAGYSFTTPISNIQISGNEIFTAIFRPQTFNTVTFRAGFHNSVTSSDATNGIYFEYNNSGSLFFKTATNSIRSTSSIITTLLVNNWYKLKITANSNATSVIGEVYNSLGVLIGSQILTTNIPRLAGTQVGAGVIATRVTAGTGVPLIDLDYVKFTLKAIR